MTDTKQIPIVILNKDRLEPLKKLVKSLKDRHYNNIIIIDNQSSYPPLLEWYKESGVEIFYNNIAETKFDTGTFYRLAVEIKHPRFAQIINDYYIFSDPDVVPIDELPINFVDDMIDVLNTYQCHKVGWALKINDLPGTEYGKKIHDAELHYWDDSRKLKYKDYELYHSAVDTTFAIYAPGSYPLLDEHGCIRIAGDFCSRHMPWYYDVDNLPEEERYYLTHLVDGRGPAYSWQVKKIMESK